jgi:hypothetical protein
MFDVRARVLSQTNFNFAGYSPFYATEQRMVDTGGTNIPHTILWQDTARPDGSRYTSGPRRIFGYDLTSPGANDPNGNLGVEEVGVTNWQYMAPFMQGVIIGENAFGLDNDTTTADTPSVRFTPSGGSVKVKVYKIANWKTSNTSTSIELSFSDGGFSALLDSTNGGYTKPVLVHNLNSGNLEVFITTSYDNTNKKYRVGRAVIDPINFTLSSVAYSYYTSDYCISNYRLSMPGSDTSPTSGNYPRARAVTGFFDIRTGNYYLPYIAYTDSNGTVRYLPGGGVQDRGQYLRLGVRCTFVDSALVSDQLYVQGYACSGRGNPSDALGNEYSYYSTRGVYSCYKYLLWSYSLPNSSGSNQPPLQFIPLTGNAISSGSFSMVSPSQVMCGLDLNEPVTKGSSEVLLLKYGWKITQATPAEEET